MAGELAVMNILVNTVAITAIVGADSPPGNSKVYPYELPQGRTIGTGAITVELDGTDPQDDKDGPSRLDYDWVMVSGYANNYRDTVNLMNAIRTALDFTFRTEAVYAGVNVQAIRFDSVNQDVVKLTDREIYFGEQRYKVRVRR